ncbi:MAG: uroporphyrinogen-III C-methyltransferase, partial [Planctomycetota bacterium]
MSEGATGRVFFFGAGPGDPALITRRGFEVIAAAELVLYDRLAARCLPEYSGSATWECVEQLPGCHPDRVVSIVERMLAAARAGQTVVRLKGGDAMVFGRSAEEWEPLLEAGIPFQVIPGVTSSLAAAAASLVTLTDRRSASAVAFITGHENPEKPGSMLDWGLLARFPGTLVFYMGVARLGHVVDQLTRHGKPAETPVAVVSNASFAHEKRL